MSMMWGLKRDRASGTRTRGTNVLDTGAPFYDTYETKDGKFVSLGSLEPQFYAELLQRLGLERRRAARADGPSGWPRAARAVHRDLFKTKTRDEWGEILEGTDVCFAPVLTMCEATDDPHIRRRATRSSTRRRAQPAPAPRFSRTPARGPAPGAAGPGQHTDEALADWGFERTDEVTNAAATSRWRVSRVERVSQAARSAADRVERRRAASSSARGDGDVADLAARARRLAVVVQVRARHARAPRRRRASRRCSSPSRSTPPRAVEPSGQPRTARRWFSNWLVSAPSIVQCPELCTRGAISFASSSPPTSNSSTRARRRSRGRRAAASRELLAAAWSASSSPGAGARLTRRMPSRCWFSTSGQHATAPSWPRTATIDSSRSNGDERLEDAAARRRARPTRRRRRPPRGARPGPCRRSRRGGSSAPRAARDGVDRGVERRRGRRPARTRGGRDPERAEASPSRRGGPATPRATARPGATGEAASARQRAASAGTPSHS